VSFAFAIFVVPPSRVIFSSSHEGRRSTYVPRINRNRMASSPRVPRQGVGLASAFRLRDMRAAWTLARRIPSTRRNNAVEQCLYRCRRRSMNSLWRFAAPPANFDKS
jgi:hypothetical protein